MPVGISRAWTVAAIGVLLTLAAGGLWSVLAQRSLGRRVGDCLWRQGCASFSLRADDRALAPQDVQAIFRLPAIQEACGQVRRCYSAEAPDEKPHLILTGTADGEEFAHHVIVPPNEPDTVLLGSLLIKLLTIRHLAADPSLRSMGELDALLARDFDDLAPQLKRLGVARIDVVGTQSVPIDEASDALRRLGQYNQGLSIRLLKP